MRGIVPKLISIIFIIFLIVGNLTAPPELKKDIAQPEGVMKVLYNAGKFFVLPFKNVKYRIDNAFNDNDDASLEFNDMETYEPPTPPGYVEDYFTFQDRTYSYLKPLNTLIIPIKTGFTLKKTTPKSIYWSFTIEELLKDMNSEPVLNLLDGMYGIYDERDRETFATLEKAFIKAFIKSDKCPDDWCEKINPVGVGWYYSPLKGLGVPPTPENIRAHYERYIRGYGWIGDGVDPVLPSKVLLENAPTDCDARIPFLYTMLYHLNKAMGFNAEYYEVIVYPKGASVPHAELFVYYPETGKWEVYTNWLSMEYYYKYPLDGVNIDAYIEYDFTERLVKVGYHDSYVTPTYRLGTYNIIHVYDISDEKKRGLYVLGGKLQFNSFEEALHWYLFWNTVDESGLLRNRMGFGLRGSVSSLVNTPIEIDLYKLPTPEDPHVYYVKEWTGRVVTVNQLREVLVERGEFREIDTVVEKNDVPPALANPEPIPMEWLPPGAKYNYNKNLEMYHEYLEERGERSGGFLDWIVDGFKWLFDVLFG